MRPWRMPQSFKIIISAPGVSRTRASPPSARPCTGRASRTCRWKPTVDESLRRICRRNAQPPPARARSRRRRASPTVAGSCARSPSVVMITLNPSFTSPTRWESGTRTSVRKTSLNRASPVIERNGRTSTPAEHISIRNTVIPRCSVHRGLYASRRAPRLRLARSSPNLLAVDDPLVPSRTAPVRADVSRNRHWAH